MSKNKTILMAKDELKLWKENEKYSTKALMDFVEQQMSGVDMENDVVVQVLKKKLGLKYRFPESTYSKTMISRIKDGRPEGDMIRVNIKKEQPVKNHLAELKARVRRRYKNYTMKLLKHELHQKFYSEFTFNKIEDKKNDQVFINPSWLPYALKKGHWLNKLTYQQIADEYSGDLWELCYEIQRRIKQKGKQKQLVELRRKRK